MSKLVNVIDKTKGVPDLERRQIPLDVDDSLSMVLQFGDSCAGCHEELLQKSDMQHFVERFQLLNSDEKAVALMVKRTDFMSQVAQSITCVGCRRSVEQMYSTIVNARYTTLEPIVISANGVLSIKREVLFDPKAMFAFFYIHGAKLEELIESIPKSKKHKRCNLHSLDNHTQKTRSLGLWQEIWALLSTDCQSQMVIVKYDALMETVETYLRKHRFCSECKSKVLRAYCLLKGEELNSEKDKNYQQSIYDGLNTKKETDYISVDTNEEFMHKLISRAEPELMGSRRERHAKTLDVAQEEVLICLGIHLYERLYKVYQKIRMEEQTWKILFFLGVDALRKNFEVALETKQGITKLERTCLELLELEKSQKLQHKELRKQQKRKKKKGSKGLPALVAPQKDQTVDAHVKSDASGSDDDDSETVHQCEKDEREPADYQCMAIQEVKPLLEAALHHCHNQDKQVKQTNKRNMMETKATSPCRCDENTNVVIAGGGDCAQHQQCTHCSAKLRDRTNNQTPANGCVVGTGWLCKHCSASPASSTSSHGCSRSDCGYSSASEGSCENCSNSGGGCSAAGSDVGCAAGVCEYNYEGDSVLCLKGEECCSHCSVVVCEGGTQLHHCKELECKHKCDKQATHCCAESGSGDGGRNGTSSDYGLSLEHMLKESTCDGDDYAIPEEEVQQFRKNNPVLQVKREKLREQLKEKFANMQLKPKDLQTRGQNGQE